MTTLGFSLELASGALTRMADVPVVAACRHGDAVFVSDGSRLCRVGGATDDGAPIGVSVTLPATDCGAPGPKRLVGVAVEGVCAGWLDVTADSDAGAHLAGEAGPAGAADTSGSALARLRRGYGRTWRVTLGATDGEALDLGAVVLTTVPLDRRPA